jgi:dTDP-4-amino-4,6-dideoxygalactose transaminase
MKKTPLSYNPIDHQKLVEVLQQYDCKFYPQLITDFEQLVVKHSGVKVVAVSSGTAALHLALKALNIGKDDFVLAPTFTYVATINPVVYVGAKPVFIGPEEETWNMSPQFLKDSLEDLAKKSIRPRAIIVVHTYGMPAKMKEILSIAAEYEIPVIEDAAEALGSSYNQKVAGTMGKIGLYSFNNNKILTTYGGGAVLTSDESLAKRIRFLATQARENLPYYEHHEVGFNYQMSVLNAAYGLAQWSDLRGELDKRKSIFSHYRKQYPQAQFQNAPDGHCSNYWLAAALFSTKEEKQAVIDEYERKGYETRPVWKSMHTQPLYQNELYYGNHWCDFLFERGLCLPVVEE